MSEVPTIQKDSELHLGLRRDPNVSDIQNWTNRLTLGETGGARIVIDENSGPMREMANTIETYMNTVSNISGKHIPPKTDDVLTYVTDYVRDAFYNGSVRKTKQFIQQNGPEIRLSKFIEAGTGMCLQTALTSAVLLRHLTERKFLDGETQVKCKSGTMDGTIANHAWAEYSPRNSKPDGRYIVDPALGVLKTYGQVKNSDDPKLFSYSNRPIRWIWADVKERAINYIMMGFLVVALAAPVVNLALQPSPSEEYRLREYYRSLTPTATSTYKTPTPSYSWLTPTVTPFQTPTPTPTSDLPNQNTNLP